MDDFQPEDLFWQMKRDRLFQPLISDTRKKMFKVIIAGSRNFTDYLLLKKTMDNLLSYIDDEIVVLCGMAKGADLLGEKYAREKGYKVEYYPADWDKYGKSAGYIRNKEMAKNADALVAFWDGKSRGTKHMINLANNQGLKVRIKGFKG